jgi:pimeloyl-ACP methyl ester carboxylesterase
LASSPTDLPLRHFAGADGLTMAYREIGEGRPAILIHGLFSNAWTNWIRYGHASRIAEAGFRVIMPDLRGHGDSAAPHDPAAYPPDILAADGEALLRHLGLPDYDLGGYSLGARTVARMLVRGAKPRRAVLSGMGLRGLLATGQRSDHFRKILIGIGNHPQGSPEWMAAAFLKTTGGDPQAMLPLLDSFVPSSAAEIAAIETSTLVLSGVEDHDNGSAAELADALTNATLVEIPGNHMSAVLKPDLGRAITEFLVA